MKKLVIDLGHGGSDCGAVGQSGTHEADVVLFIGKELGELLKGYDIDVKFTRTVDKFISLSERVKIAILRLIIFYLLISIQHLI